MQVSAHMPDELIAWRVDMQFRSVKEETPDVKDWMFRCLHRTEHLEVLGLWLLVLCQQEEKDKAEEKTGGTEDAK